MKENRKRRKKGSHIATFFLVAALMLFAIYLGGRWFEDRSQQEEPRGDSSWRYENDTVIEVDGVSYRERKDLTTVLLMGIDKQTGNNYQSGFRDGGQVDFLRLVVLDPSKRKITQIEIDRDTMTPISILGVLGNFAGTRTAQICLSHGFGKTEEQSCSLTVEAVSRLLHDVKIDFYASMNLDGISVLNDLADGITVTLADDFSAIDPMMTKGTTLKLVGDQAEYYVRSRMSIGVGTNEARMARQDDYLSKLMQQLDGKLSANQNFAGDLYDALEPYLSTDFSRGRLINEVWLAKDYARAGTIKPTGTHEIGSDGFMEFHPDEELLQQIILEQFYEPLM